jgi:hypothetical protein
MAFSIDDGLLSARLDVPDQDYIVVASGRELQRLCADILGPRPGPVIGLTLDADGEPVLSCADLRALVGAGVRIYLLASDELLCELRQALGSRLALDRGAVRVWWPGAEVSCDPADHPSVLALEDEPCAMTLQELALQYDLTRPRVRTHIKLIEDARAFVEHELALAQKHNRLLSQALYADGAGGSARVPSSSSSSPWPVVPPSTRRRCRR